MPTEPKIVFAPTLDPEVLAIGQGLIPSGFRFEMVASSELPTALGDADFLMGFIPTLSDETLVSAKQLKLVQLMSAGYDKFNLEGARKARLPVSVNGGANAISVAEHAIMLMLTTLKHVTELDHRVRSGRWRSADHGGLRIHELCTSTVGIVGMGRIGQEVARRLQGWQARLLYFDPYRLNPEREADLHVTYQPLDDLLRVSDVVSVHVPLNAETRNLIDAESLSIMKPSAVVINTARGGLVDEEALTAALKEGRIAGAGLDVLEQEPPPNDHPLFEIPNTVLTPHMAGPTWESWPRRFANSFANIQRVHGGQPPQWVVTELLDLFPDSR